MNAIGVTEAPEVAGVADSLEMLNIPVPRPGHGEIAVRVLASAMHIDEIYAVQGTALGRFYGPRKVTREAPYIMGSTLSGVVVAVGESVDSFRVGDEVISVPSGHPASGFWATYRCLDQKSLLLKPGELTHTEAAAATMASCVAWAAITCAGVRSGHRCIVVGASGGIGAMVLQYLKSMNCHVLAVCSAANSGLVERLGADAVVDYTLKNFADEATSGAPYDVVLDCVGGREVEHRGLKSLKKSGAFVTVVGPNRYIGEQRLSWPALIRWITHIGWKMLTTRLKSGPRYSFSATLPLRVIHEAMAHLLQFGIRMPIHKTIPFDVNAVADAIRLLYTHRARGRIVIEFPAEPDARSEPGGWRGITQNDRTADSEEKNG